jgi:hypothetical protein
MLRQKRRRDENQLYDIYEAVGSDAADLLQKLEDVEKALTATDGSLKEKLEDAIKCESEKEELLKTRIETADAICARSPDICSGADVTLVRNAVADINRVWARLATEKDKKTRVQRLRRRLGACRLATEPLVTSRPILVAQVRRALQGKFVGQAAPLDEVLGRTTLPNDARTRVIQELVSEEMALDGVVEPTTGAVYKISRNRAVQISTALLPIVFAFAGAGFLFLLTRADDWFGIPDKDWPNQLDSWQHGLLRTYVLVLVGALLHLVVERTKRLQDGIAANIVVAGQTLRWLHLRWLQISASLIGVVATVIGLELANEDQWLTVLAAGYAVDSLGGVFIGRFVDVAGTRAAAVKAAIGLSSGAKASTASQ